jgi:hypothetical protein
MDFLDGFYLRLRGNELFLEFILKIGPGAIINGGSSQGGGQVVTGPISGRSSYLEVRKGSRDFLSFIGIYSIIDVVIILEGISERFGLHQVSIKGIWCHSNGS